MSTRALPYAFLALSLVALGGCDKPEDKPSGQPASTAAAAPAAPAASSEVAASDSAADDIPTEADFEDEAEQTISTANLESQLDALEKEIAD